MARFDLKVNGVARSLDCDAETPLLFALREGLGLTGAKYGCGEGQCGACTVLLDGKPVRSCLTQVSAATGKAVTTIEGLEENGRLHPVQQAFLDAGVAQCGYCTPGMIVEAAAFLRKTPRPSAAEVQKAMEGHICRCGTYPRVLEAIERAGGGAK
jgi:aerobic-type carbon monoxide dehydrogenase small subunit (CoxS/CutS family)